MKTLGLVFVLFAVFGQTEGYDTNIAKGGIATQSSQYGYASPDKAIDGNRASDWFRGSCSTTKSEMSPWWRLDLLKPYKISNVTVTVRGDRYCKRMNGAKIHIGNSLVENGTSNPRCAVMSRLTPGSTKTYVCNGMEGRYINIVIPGKKRHLTLCEVQVTGQPSDQPVQNETNIAKRGIAAQSSQYLNYSPDKAIDGNHDSNVNSGSCSVTNAYMSPWWRLDLMKTYKINTVTVTIREDSYYKTIYGAEIRIGNSLDYNGNVNPRCAVISNPAPGSTNTYVCNGMEGRYLNIVIPGKKQYLTLCEVKVTGQPSENPAPAETNIARRGIAAQSSQYLTASPDKAIDGNHDSNANYGSCSTTKNDVSPWWRLDLLKTYKINTVTVTIRNDANYKRMYGAEIRIGNSLDHNGNVNPRCAVMSNPAPGSTNTYVCNGMEGRYINIVNPGKRQYLTLCEVEVTGQLSERSTPTERNIARRGIATQSSQYGNYNADRAIDGNHDSNVNSGSCCTTNGYMSPWWRLDLLKTYKINTVTVTVREDGYSKRIDGAEIRIGNSLDQNGNINPRCAVISNPAPGSTNTYVCDGMEGRYVNIVIPGKKQYLSVCEVEVTGHPSEKPTPAETNIANGQIATQSSQYQTYSPAKAIDGNSDSNWNYGSCSMTNTEMSPWWRLDLSKPYKIDTVTVTIRNDANYRRIYGAEIRIGNSLDHNGNVNPRCAVISNPAPGSTSTYVCNGMEGRYINIVIPGQSQYLSLCEVKVTGQLSERSTPTERNIARRGIATQSSQYGNYNADRAIDGNHDSNVNSGSCCTTNGYMSPWWRLDLLKTYKINTVTVTVRADGYSKRIDGAEIRIGNSLDQNGNINPRCAVISKPAPGSTNTYVCNGMEGRYVNIVIPGQSQYLSVCEVEVTGHPSEKPVPVETNIANGGVVTQSSQYGTLSAEKAIDGNSDSDWNQGSCSMTNSEMNPWWRLDLLKTYKIDTVTVTIREGSYYKRIYGAEIRIGNSLDDNGNVNPRCAVISNPAPGSTNTYVCNAMEGRYLNIVIPGKRQYLTLCEVKVTGQLSANPAPTETNIAKGGIATQSSQHGNYNADRANDGNHDSNVNSGSCSTTQNLMSPWWRLDLLTTYIINTVTVTIREDSYYKRINGAEIRIGNSLNDNGNVNPRCAVISDPAPGSTNTYVCKGMEGRYINIVIPGKKEYLTLCEVKVTGQLSEQPAPTETNIAKGGIATQSGQYLTHSPHKAIDGNPDSDVKHGSCSTTKNNMSPWWRLDLLKTYKVNNVSVTIREDTRYKTIDGAEIRIGNSLENNGNLNPRCAVISNPAPGSTNTYVCKGMEGRYINIVIPGKKEYLTLCEVKVTGHPSEKPAPTETNIAKGGIATQSSQYGNYNAHKAIDGNHDSNVGYGSCSVTNAYMSPWWRLDLLKTYKIDTVTVTIREDSSYKVIIGAEIRIGNSLDNSGNSNPRCAVISNPAPGSTNTYVCNGMEGRYINIVIPGKKQYLTLCEVKVTGQLSKNPAPTEINIAKGGIGTQSSQYSNYSPDKAIDGNHDSNVGYGSCSVTNAYMSPWWRLDLLKTYKINTVTVTIRKDSYYKTIDGAEIRIGNSLDNNGNVNPRCAVISNPAPGSTKKYVCNGMEGRYINIVIPGKKQYLTLCEVTVTGHPTEKPAPPETNIARGGIATQSSQYQYSSPDKAIDGNCNSNWNKGSCSMTNSELSPWWRLDLLKTYKINTVTVTIREDSYYKRIYGAEIHIGNSPDLNSNSKTRCAVISNLAPGSTNTYVCNGMEGRYINIVIPGKRQYLTLCEVKVTGQLSKNPAPAETNIAKGRIATQSSQYGTHSANKAIDGNSDSNVNHGSCSITNTYLSPWWRLDLLKTYKIHNVTVTIRKDSYYKVIIGAEIRIGNSLHHNGNANPRCAVISHAAPGSTNTYSCKGMEGRYINIVIPGKNQYLSLCEVKVTGQPSEKPALTETNIAKGGIATQSSQYGTYSPEKAIDGNLDGNVGYGSCSITSSYMDPWWRLDLLKTYEVKTVTVTISQDSYYWKRINGAEIRIGNSLKNNGNGNPRCAVISNPAPGSTNTYDCKGMEGRYINIVIPGKREYLALCEVKVTGRSSEKPAATESNIAKGGIATQSSQYGTHSANKAIDGNSDSNVNYGSCSTTNTYMSPWWRLDLLKTYKINTVTVTVRKDSYYKRMNGAEIRIGNSLDNSGNSNPRCAVITNPAPGSTKTYACNGMEGRYINIVIPGKKEYLSICEVKVTGQPSEKPTPTETNIAKGGIATQSSQYQYSSPDKAIDGNFNSNWNQGSCSMTNVEMSPWWRLDLFKQYKINTVTVTIREDSYYKRIYGAEIRIGNSLNDNGNANPRCTVISNPAPGSTNTYVCNGMEGRYINIVIPGKRQYLTLCEVKVTGQLSEKPAPAETNIARRGIATQSSQYGNYNADRAIDGNSDSNVNHGSCSTTNTYMSPWWRLDLLKTHKIDTVTVTIRGDSYYKTIDGAEIRIGNSLDYNGNLNPRCAVISNPAPGSTKTYSCKGMEGRYINIVIPGKKQYLTLCEVKVTGQPTEKPAPTEKNIAKGGIATQSSQHGNSNAHKAIDGNHDSNVNSGSCSTTQNLVQSPWWRLDLLKTYKINTVTVTIREDSYYKRINGAEIRIGNSLTHNGTSNPRCAVISNPAPGSTNTYDCKGMEGRYINIVIPGKKEYLTLCEVKVTGHPSEKPAPTETNIVKRGIATQSSQYQTYSAEKAIDGNLDSNWKHGSCSTTNAYMSPWWRLDLLKAYRINKLSITIREDTLYKRIKGAEIRIGNSLAHNGNVNPRCAVISNPTPGSKNIFACNGMEGRYINIVIPGQKQYLTLCELEINGHPSGKPVSENLTDINIATGGIATQSSQCDNESPDKAIDGNLDSNWFHGSCSTTQNEMSPWWRLDLLQPYEINTVTVTIRGDCCHERINGAEIRIGNSLDNNGNSNPRCAVISSLAPGSTKTYFCTGMQGRYVNIVLPWKKQNLTLCEVQVTGQPYEKPTAINIAKEGKVTQSSTHENAAPERAIDGNRSTNWHQGSCSTTQKERSPWWRLDLLKPYEIYTVTVTIRGDCCHQRINGAQIRIGNSLHNNGNSNPRCAVIKSLSPGTTKTFSCNGLEGRFINIVIPGKKEILTLCEVEVTGKESTYEPEVCN